MKSQQQQSVLQEQLANNREAITRLTAEKADALLQVAELKQSLKEAQVCKLCFAVDLLLCGRELNCG